MERNIPLYSHDGALVEWINQKRLDRLLGLGRVARVVRHKKGRIARAILHRMPGEPRPSFLADYKGQKYCYRQYLDDGHRCYRLRNLGRDRSETNLAPPEVGPIFLRVLLDCLAPAA
ncbi:MAG: hypothetical protein ACM3ZB_06640 [bacterium]